MSNKSNRSNFSRAIRVEVPAAKKPVEEEAKSRGIAQRALEPETETPVQPPKIYNHG